MPRPRDLRPASERARHPVVRDREKTLEIGRRYMAGETIKGLAEDFGCGHETIRKILHLQGVVCRQRGPTGPATGDRRSKYPHESSIPAQRRTQPRVWCAQCERNVVVAEAEKCRSRWCKARTALPQETARHPQAKSGVNLLNQWSRGV